MDMCGKIMKNVIKLILIITAIPCFAQATGDMISFRNGFPAKGMGRLTFKLTDVGETADMPYRLEIKITCIDKRSQPNSVKPRPQVVVQNLDMCDFYWPPRYDEKTGKLTISYTVIDEKTGGQTKCSIFKEKDFVLNQDCEAWRN